MPFVDRIRINQREEFHSSADERYIRPPENYTPYGRAGRPYTNNDSSDSGYVYNARHQYQREFDFQHRQFGSHQRGRAADEFGNRQPSEEHERRYQMWGDYSDGGRRSRPDIGLNHAPMYEDRYSQSDYWESRRNQYERERYYESEDTAYRRYSEERFARASFARERSSTPKTTDNEPFYDHRREEKKSEV